MARRLSIRVQHEHLHVVVDIVDQGPGMSPEFIRDQLFQPFRSTKSGGHGIGAYQARELLRESGGDLLVLSQPRQRHDDAASCCRRWVPRRRARPSCPPDPDPSHGQTQDSGRRG